MPTAANSPIDGNKTLDLNSVDQAVVDNKSRSKVNYPKLFKLYVLPVIVIAILLIILIGFILPKVSDLFVKLNQLSNVEAEVKANLETRRQLELVRSNFAPIQDNLRKLGIVIPEGKTEVVNFQRKVIGLAEANGLNIGDAVTGEQVLTDVDNGSRVNSDSGALSIIEIPSTFKVSGTLGHVRAFIDAVQAAEDFVIIKEMRLNTSITANISELENINAAQWGLELVLVKYQFRQPDAVNKLAELYQQVPPAVIVDPEVLQFIEQRVNK